MTGVMSRGERANRYINKYVNESGNGFSDEFVETRPSDLVFVRESDNLVGKIVGDLAVDYRTRARFVCTRIKIPMCLKKQIWQFGNQIC